MTLLKLNVECVYLGPILPSLRKAYTLKKLVCLINQEIMKNLPKRSSFLKFTPHDDFIEIKRSVST